jgi:hypothetical protein
MIFKVIDSMLEILLMRKYREFISTFCRWLMARAPLHHQKDQKGATPEL